MKLLAVIAPPPDIYHGCPTHKTIWEEKFTPVNMTSCVRQNVRKHREIKDGEHYIALEIYLKLDFLAKRKVTSSESRGYMGISGKGVTTSLDLRTKSPNKKKKSWIAITDITNQYFRKFIKKFNN